ncbi:amidase [Microbacterium protaetiae]|uniref:Amidase n=1 Tax=Microbacterium protaetiae TaxID=2509458 RepID=A0A4P6EE45_9MICO|nr:amidase family protein [Microbacterium protaetiae]QAY60565.1 amidase [Microbacterium protaetiae]
MTSVLPDAVTLAADIRAGRVPAAEAVDAHLTRIAARNPHLNALTVTFDDRARRAADDIDRAVAAGRDPGPLAGVPFSVKENIDLTWSATTEGWRGLAEAIPARDATVVARLRAAGAIPIGRGNMPDFGMRWDTDNDLFGRTLNPFDESRTTFGSSGGDAVAVATGMSTIGLGNDFGGSIRLPAQALGVCGLRPSVGRVPRAAVDELPVALTLQRFAVNGMLARSVRDLRAVLDVVAGVDVDDPVSLALPAVAAYDGPHRVAVTRDPLGWGVQPDVAAGVERAADALRTAGWQVDEIELPHLEEAFTLMRRLAVTDMSGGALPAPLGRSADAFMRASMQATGVFETAAEYGAAWARRLVIEAAWRRLQVEHPVILGPVSAGGILPIDFDLGGPEQATAAWRMLRLVVVVNFLGLPAVAVPTGPGADGMPTGVQLIGPMHGEAAALAAARVVEAA